VHRLLCASARFYITVNTQKTNNWHNSVVLPLPHFYQDHREICLKAHGFRIVFVGTAVRSSKIIRAILSEVARGVH